MRRLFRVRRKGEGGAARRAGAFALVRRLAGRDESGATAVEFAIVSIPVFATIFFLVENGYVFFVQSQLEMATAKAARTVMLGSAQRAGMTEAQFRQTVCSSLILPTGCADRLFIDVRSVSGSMTNYLTAANIDRVQNRFCLGGSGQYTIIRIAYASPVISSVWQTSPTYVNGTNVRMLRAGLVFKNEPFTTTGGTSC